MQEAGSGLSKKSRPMAGTKSVQRKGRKGQPLLPCKMLANAFSKPSVESHRVQLLPGRRQCRPEMVALALKLGKLVLVSA